MKILLRREDLSSTIGRIDYDYLQFPGGEPHIKIKAIHRATYPKETTIVCIHIKIKSFNDIGKLLVTTDAIRRMGYRRIELITLYFPGGRQDRVALPGESLTVKVYADLINSIGFEKVRIMDPHSNVTPALINNCVDIGTNTFIKKSMIEIFK